MKSDTTSTILEIQEIAKINCNAELPESYIKGLLKEYQPERIEEKIELIGTATGQIRNLPKLHGWYDIATVTLLQGKYSVNRLRYCPKVNDLRSAGNNTLDVQKCLATLPYASKTKYDIYTTLKAAFKSAVMWKMLSQNPLEFVKAPTVKQKEMCVWSEKEATKFLNVAKKYRYYVLKLWKKLQSEEILKNGWRLDKEKNVYKKNINLIG